MKNYYPEGTIANTPENLSLIRSARGLAEAAQSGKILEARAVVCDAQHNLIVNLPCMKGIIPHNEGAVGIADGTAKDIALITKVNKYVCFKVMSVETDENGKPYALLSRRLAQLECIENYINRLHSGDIIPARVTHLEQFGCFVDIGCGIPSLLPIDAISVSRISHPSDRFSNGQNIKVIVKENADTCDREQIPPRIWLSHKELLGTWQENANLFSVGETVAGVIRSVESYGVFVELAPNLAGLAELKENVDAGQCASVYIKAIIPEKMKIKLIIVDSCTGDAPDKSFKYFCNDKHMDYWKYSTDLSEKVVESFF